MLSEALKPHLLVAKFLVLEAILMGRSEFESLNCFLPVYLELKFQVTAEPPAFFYYKK